MSNTVAVAGVGAAAGALRLEAGDVARAWGRGGGRGTTAVCAPDEDPLTLAWDAATGALRAAGLDGEDVGGLWWGTSRPPFAEGPSHAYLAASLGLRAGATGALLSGSPHAGIDALLAAADALGAGTVDTALVVMSDAVVPGTGTGFEARAGAGGVALVLTGGDTAGGVAQVRRRVTRSQPVVDRYRGDREHATRDLYDARLFREEIFVPAVVEIAGALEAPEAARWSLPDPDGRLGAALARRLATDPVSATVFATVGDTAAAAPLLGALGGLAERGPLGVIAYGGGRTTGILVAVDEPVAGAADALRGVLEGGRDASYPEVLRARGELVAVGESVEMGLPPGGAAFVRGNPEMLGLLGGKCIACGTIATPPSIHPHCIACGEPKLEPVAVAREGTVHTYVVNQTMPAPFEAPLPLAVLDLEDGARLMLQATGVEGLEIGAEVELVLRRYAVERGVPVYGYKARPRGAAAGRDG